MTDAELAEFADGVAEAIHKFRSELHAQEVLVWAVTKTLAKMVGESGRIGAYQSDAAMTAK